MARPIWPYDRRGAARASPAHRRLQYQFPRQPGEAPVYDKKSQVDGAGGFSSSNLKVQRSPAARRP